MEARLHLSYRLIFHVLLLYLPALYVLFFRCCFGLPCLMITDKKAGIASFKIKKKQI